MTRTSEATPFPRRHALLTTFAAVAFLAAFGAAQAQNSTGSPTQTNPSATDNNSQSSQGMVPSPRTRTDTMRSDRSTNGSSSMGSMAQSGTPGTATGSPTQVNPDSRDSNREASQGMVPNANQNDTRSRVDTSSPGLRNDRPTMARAPRADRN